MATSLVKKKVLVKKVKNENDGLMVYCRKCTKTKPSKEFFIANDKELDQNGFMSICKTCCNEVYSTSFTIERNFEKALLRSCKILNIAWIPNAVNAAKTHIEKFKSQGKEDIQIFGIYKSKLATLGNLADGQLLTFEEYPRIESISSNTPEENADKTYQELQKFWGKGKSYDEITYLQNEFNELGGATVKDDRPKAILLREICFQLLSIENDRIAGVNVEKRVKALGEMMSDSAIRPDQKKVADGNKSSEAFGVWLADIEKYKPAEWWKNQNIYKDVNNIKEYWELHVLRPFLNFWGVQKNMTFPGAVERNDFSDDNPDSFQEE
jgi:hypothetical protein